MIKRTMFVALAFASTLAMADEFFGLDLEPCINGAVSATGEFPEQETEDLVAALIAPDRDAYALEPCINGDVSASGLYVNQEVEDAVQRALARHR